MMSGGSWDYVYCKIDEASSGLLCSKRPERRALGRLMEKVAVAMHDIEWVDSCDKSKGSDVEAIRDALGENADVLILSEIVTEAVAVRDALTEMIERIDHETRT